MPYYKTDSIVKYCKKCDEFCVGLIVMHIDNIDYIFHTHAKFYNVHEDYVETAVAIPEVVEAFKKAGYKGFLSSEYEGGEHLRDVGVDSIEQVRRHQEAMRRAIEG